MRIINASILSLGIRTVAILAGIGTTVLLSRVLGAEGYGLYLYLLNLALLLSVPILAGLPVLLTREIAMYRAARRYGAISGLVVTGTAYTLVTSALISAGFVLLNSTFDLLAPNEVVFLAGLLFLIPLSQIATAIIYGYEKPVIANSVEGLVRPLGMLALLGVLAAVQFLSVTTSIAAYCGSLLFAIVFAAGYILRRLYRPTVSPSGRFLMRLDLRAWLWALLPLGAIAITGVINGRVDVVFLGIFSSKAEVAVYGVAQQIVGIAAIVRITTLGIAGPRFSNLWAKGDRVGIGNLIVSVNRINLLGAAAMTLFLFLFSENIIVWLIDEDFTTSASLAVISCMNIIFVSLLGPSPVLLTMCGFERFFLKSSIAMALLNVALNLIFIPKYGAYGALLSSVCSEILFQVICLSFCSRHLGINTVRLA